MKFTAQDFKIYLLPLLALIISTLVAITLVTIYSENVFEQDRLLNSEISSKKIQYYFSNHGALAVIKTQAAINKNIINTIKNNRTNHLRTLKDLEKIKTILSASIVYILNNKGDTIASTKYNGNKSLTGNNYSFRKYFLTAMKGKSAVIPALGVTTKKRGIYFATPIYAGKKRGVLVAKLSTDELDQITSSKNDNTFKLILTPDKYVFSGGKKNWVFIPNQHTQASKQQSVTMSLPFDVTNKWIDFNGNRYLNFNYELHFQGERVPWSFSSLYLWPKPYRYVPKLVTTILMVIFNLLFWSLRSTIKKKRAAIKEKMESRKVFETIVREAPFGIMIMSKEKRVVDANPEAVRLLGRKNLDEIKDKVCHNFICPMDENQCPVWDKHEVINKSERRILNPHRGEVAILKTCLPITYRGEQCLLETFIDITDQKQAYKDKEEAYKKVLHNSKLAALGSFTSGITHEINNPLAIVAGYLKILKNDLVKDTSENKQKYIEQIQAIEESTERISKIVDDLQVITNDSFAASDTISSHDVLDKTIKLLSTSQDQHHYQVDIDKQARRDYINGSFSSLSQIFLQILNNAVEAIRNQEGGQIGISTFNSDDKLVIEFSNNGPSIPEKYREHIFEIFFTTHEHGKHAGTGLSICHSLTTAMNGEIEYVPLKPKGSKFVLRFPHLNRMNFGDKEG